MAVMDIQVRLFNEILIWPLAITGADTAASTTDFMDSFHGQLLGQLPDGTRSPWQRVTDLRQHIVDSVDDENPDAGSIHAYEEAVYFHPFVQKFLFADQSNPNVPRIASLRLYRRDDVKHVRMSLPEKAGDPRMPPYWLKVDRINLYVFEAGILVLVVEVSSSDGLAVRVDASNGQREAQPMTLADAQIVLNRLRRAYPAFWPGDPGNPPGECFSTVEWLIEKTDKTGGALTSPGPVENEDKQHIGRYRETSRPPVFGHWRALLAPLCFEAYVENDKSTCSLRHIVDDLIPTMILLGVDDPRTIARSDWVRLCFADGPGKTAPYAENALTSFEADHCYDRFWQADGRNGLGWCNTRYLCSGYNFVAVGQAGDPANDKKGFFRNTVARHFRRHYFQLGLLNHFQKAALLTLSDAVSDAIAKYSGRDQRAELRDRIAALQERALNFTHCYWFTDLTNHVQGRELFAWWQSHLGTTTVFDQATREIAESNQFLNAWEQKQQSREALRLNYLAAAGLVLGLTTGALGMNVLAGNKWLDRSGWNELGFTFFLFAMLVMIGWYIADEMTKMRKCRKSKWLAYSLWTTAFLLVTIGFGLLMK
jgi:hypothetical protein